MVLNAAVQMLRDADDLKQKIFKFKSGTSMLQEHTLWTTQQQLQNLYQKVLVLDLDYALDKKVEQDLWNVGFKQQIEALQAISKDRKNPLRSEGQAMLSWVLQAAAGFYLCLLHQICTTFKLDLPFRRRASLLGWVEGWGCGEGTPPPAAARYICQHCLVHLGDLARYRHQLRQAHTFYRHAVVVWASSGQPYNQLALVSWRRGRKLSAVYWHVRSLQVRAPFPPAPANLARTLALCASTQNKDLPVIPGVTVQSSRESTPASILPATLDAHAYVTELIRAVHYIHTAEQLDTAAELVKKLNSSLTPLIATNSFESMTLIKMSCILIWLVHATTEDLTDRTALTESEKKAASLSEDLCAAAILALLLPNYTSQPNSKRLPSLKVWLQWLVHFPQQMKAAAWSARLQLWPAFAHTFNLLAGMHCSDAHDAHDQYETVPLSEDEELQGFLPLERAHKGLKFASHTAWDTYGGRIPDIALTNGDQAPSDIIPSSLNEPELENKVRAHRILQLGTQLADICTEQLSYSVEESKLRFTATAVCGEQLSAALAELTLAAASQPPHTEELDEDSDDEKAPPAPTVISEADFRERFREKRVGILKPQGSLERAREERAMATQEDVQEPEPAEELVRLDDKKEARKQRVNIAMAAIMRKQEESNKQVKFVSPPPTPDSAADPNEVKEDKPKVIQPKPVKSLANLPVGRKTGGILSLKDKSAGYPHLVNIDPEPEKKKEDRKDHKQINNSQNSQQKQQTWGPNQQTNFNDQPRMNFQKNYGLQNVGISYNPTYQPPNLNNQGIRLPVVNPKEIDVRTAALQKQNSRQELFQDGPKLNHPVSGDKRNFLNDLPPRFANQYRYWQTPQEQFGENKFREDNASSTNMFNNHQQRPNWMNPQTPDFQQTMSWWKPENPPNYTNFSNPPPLNMQTNFFNPQLTSNMSNPYQNMSYDPMQNPNMGQSKPDLMTPGYLQPSMGQPQMPTLQNLVASPNFSSSLNNFGTYAAPSVGYDSTMYPQFNTNKLSFPPPNMTMPNPQFIGPTKPTAGFQANKDMMEIGTGLGFGQNYNTNMSFNEPLGGDGGQFNTDQTGTAESSGEGGAGGSTYSLFSGAPAAAWGQHQSPQSLWSGPGPSPLERLLEQQKQMKPPPPAQ